MSKLGKSDEIKVTVMLELPEWLVTDAEVRLVESHFEKMLMAMILQADTKRGYHNDSCALCSCVNDKTG